MASYKWTSLVLVLGSSGFSHAAHSAINTINANAQMVVNSNTSATTGDQYQIQPGGSVLVTGTGTLNPSSYLVQGFPGGPGLEPIVFNNSSDGLGATSTGTPLIDMSLVPNGNASLQPITFKLVNGTGGKLTGNINLGNNILDFTNNDSQASVFTSNYNGVISGSGTSATLKVSGNLNYLGTNLPVTNPLTYTPFTSDSGIPNINIASSMTLALSSPYTIKQGKSLNITGAGTFKNTIYEPLLLGAGGGSGAINISNSAIAQGVSAPFLDVSALNNTQVYLVNTGTLQGDIVVGNNSVDTTNILNFTNNDNAATPTTSNFSGAILGGGRKTIGDGTFNVIGVLNLTSAAKGLHSIVVTDSATLALNQPADYTLISGTGNNNTLNLSGAQTLQNQTDIGSLTNLNITNTSGTFTFAPKNPMNIHDLQNFNISGACMFAPTSTMNIQNVQNLNISNNCTLSPTSSMTIANIQNFSLTGTSNLTITGNTSVTSAINLASSGASLNLSGTSGTPTSLVAINSVSGSTITAGMKGMSSVTIGPINLGGTLNINGAILQGALSSSGTGVVSVQSASTLTQPMTGLSAFGVLGSGSAFDTTVSSLISATNSTIDTGPTSATTAGSLVRLILNSNAVLNSPLSLITEANVINLNAQLNVNGGTSSGAVTVDAKSQVVLAAGAMAGPLTLNGTLTATGGTLSGALTANTNSTVMLSGAAATLSGPITLATNLQWSAGQITNVITGSATSALTIPAANTQNLNLVNSMSGVPTLNHLGSGTLTVSTSLTGVTNCTVAPTASIFVDTSGVWAMPAVNPLILNGSLTSNSNGLSVAITGGVSTSLAATKVNFVATQAISNPIIQIPTINIASSGGPASPITVTATSPLQNFNAINVYSNSNLILAVPATVPLPTPINSNVAGASLNVMGGVLTLTTGAIGVPVNLSAGGNATFSGGSLTNSLSLNNSSISLSGGTVTGVTQLSTGSSFTGSSGNLSTLTSDNTSSLTLNGAVNLTGAINMGNGHLSVQQAGGPIAPFEVKVSHPISNVQNLVVGTATTLTLQTGGSLGLSPTSPSFTLNGTLNLNGAAGVQLFDNVLSGSAGSIMNINQSGVVFTHAISPASLNISLGSDVTTSANLGNGSQACSVQLAQNSSLTLNSGATLTGPVTGQGTTSVLNINQAQTLSQVNQVSVNVTGVTVGLGNVSSNLASFVATNAIIQDLSGLDSTKLNFANGSTPFKLLGGSPGSPSTLNISALSQNLNFPINDPTLSDATYANTVINIASNAAITQTQAWAIGKININSNAKLTNRAAITAASQINIASTALLNMQNTIGKLGATQTAINNSGTLSLNAPQTLNGSYTGSGTLQFVINADGSYGSLQVNNGSFSLASGGQLMLSVADYTTLPATANYQLISCSGTGTINPTGLSIINPSNLPPVYTVSAPVVTANSYSVSISRPSFQSFIQAPAVAIIAAGLDQLRDDLSTPSALALFGALDRLPNVAAAEAALSSLLPTNHGGALFASRQLPQAAFNRVGERLTDLRVARMASGYVAGDFLDDFDDSVTEPGAFTPLIYMNRDHNPATASSAGFQNQTYGLGLMRDVQVLEDYLVGAGISYAHSHIKALGPLSEVINVKTYQGMVYGSFQRHQYFAEIYGAMALSQFDGKRSINFIQSQAASSYSGKQAALRSRLGYVFQSANVSLTPQVSFQWGHTRQDGYQETGAGIANLNLSQVDFASMQVGAGLGLSVKLPSLVETKLKLKLMRYRDIKTEQGSWQAAFLAGGPNFVVTSPVLAKDSHSLNLSITSRLRRDMNLALDYDITKKGQLCSHAAYLKLRWVF